MGTKEVDLKKIIDCKIVYYILNILFGISTAALTFFWVDQEFPAQYTYVLLPILSFFTIEFIAFKFQFLKKVFKSCNLFLLIASIILGMVTIYTNCRENEFRVFIEQCNICAILAIPAISIFLYAFYDKFIFYMKKYFKSLDKIEKNYLIIFIIIFTIFINVIYNLTTVFYSVIPNGENYSSKIVYEAENPEKEWDYDALSYSLAKHICDTMMYDIIYTTDTGPIFNTDDAFMNVSKYNNDVKQPLFGVISIPLVIIPKTISYLLPNSNIYAVLLTIVHGILTAISFTLLSRLMKLKGISKAFVLTILTLVYPTLLFLINIEQYIIPTFYLVCFLYFAIKNLPDKDMLYIMATGGMLTNGILFPLLGEKKDWKKSIKNIFYTFLKCLAILIISAKISIFFPDQIFHNMGGVRDFIKGEKYTLEEKANMYSNFLNNSVYFSDFDIKDWKGRKILTLSDFILDVEVPSKKIESANTTQLNITGVVIGGLAILGFILNRKDRFTQISFIWCLLSVFLLFGLNYGVDENGLILYSFYFSWAFVCLIIKLIESLLKNYKKIKYTVYTVAIMSLCIVNLYGVYQLIQFGIQYYRC